MGQPTSALTQRLGKAQLWQISGVNPSTEPSHADLQFKLSLVARLGTLFFLSPPVLHNQHL